MSGLKTLRRVEINPCKKPLDSNQALVCQYAGLYANPAHAYLSIGIQGLPFATFDIELLYKKKSTNYSYVAKKKKNYGSFKLEMYLIAELKS